MMKHIMTLGLSLPFLYPLTTMAEIPVDIEALIQAKSIAQTECFDQRYETVKPACESRRILRDKIQQAGWCYRYPMKGEEDGTHVRCSTSTFENVYIDIDLKFGKPTLTERFAKWEMELYDKGMNGTDPTTNRSIGNLSFTCNRNAEPKAVVMLNDDASDFADGAFETELKINFKDYPADVEISRPGSGFTKVIFGKENTLELLKWVDESIGRYSQADFKAREIGTDRQVHFLLHNLTTKNKYAAEVKDLLRWSTAMRNRCEI
ncbi:MAG: hypothetical protein ABJN69_15970 [Hellea sp.]